MVYLDNAATTPINKKALKQLTKWNKNFGNSESVYKIGRKAAEVVEKSRTRICDFIGCHDPNRLFFTSGGSEANSWVISSETKRLLSKGKKICIAITGIEHHSIINAVEEAKTLFGAKVVYFPINKDGFINLNYKSMGDFFATNKPDLVCFSIINNEIGTIETSYKNLIHMAHKNNCKIHIDCVQGLPHMDLSYVIKSGADFLSISAHKIGGPKGIGVLYVGYPDELYPLIHGGAQESGKRGGTLNAGLIAAFGTAVENFRNRESLYKVYYDYIKENLIDKLKLKINGPKEECTYGIINFDCGIESSTFVTAMDFKGIYVSTGSACNGSGNYSHVLEKTMKNPTYGLRVSFGTNTKFKDVKKFVREFIKNYKALKKLSDGDIF